MLIIRSLEDTFIHTMYTFYISEGVRSKYFSINIIFGRVDLLLGHKRVGKEKKIVCIILQRAHITGQLSTSYHYMTRLLKYLHLNQYIVESNILFS